MPHTDFWLSFSLSHWVMQDYLNYIFRLSIPLNTLMKESDNSDNHIVVEGDRTSISVSPTHSFISHYTK